jgi:hypothetical protein
VKARKKYTAFILATALGSWLISCEPVHAQVWGYSPYSGSATWLSLARGLSYPLNRISGVRTPFYLANNLIYGASYGIFGNRQRNMNYGVYNDPEPLNDPRQRSRPYNTSQGSVGDQIVHARWSKQQQDFDQQQGEDDNVPVPQNSGQNWIANPVVTPQAVPEKKSEFMPPVAPQIASSVASPGSIGFPSHASEPLAQGFVQVLNEQYGGNIGNALRDKDLRKYAHSVGLIDSDKYAADKIASQKIDLIRAILADSTESASTKINAVRMLLKH